MYTLILTASASPRKAGEVRYDLKPLANPIYKQYINEVEIYLIALNLISYLTEVLIKWQEV